MKKHCALTLLIALFAVTAHAHAVDIQRSHMRNATNLCQGALPNFEGSIRKRPLGIANEGNSVAFITCSLEGANDLDYTRTGIYVAFQNTSSVQSTVNCTLVNGSAQGAENPTYTPRTAAIPPAGIATLSWSGSYQIPNLSCTLAPGIVINHIIDFFPENVGE